MSTDKTKVKEKSSQERNFKKLSNVEHVRMRTGMWLGQNSASTFEQHFFRKNNEGKYEIVHEELEDVPAKLKCLDEACMNAVDEYRKNQKDKSIPEKDKMSKLIVQLSSDRKCVTIADNGRGIPATNAEGVYLHLMYGENFDDHVKQDHVAGQNGVGISLVRMVSNYFKVKTVNNGSSFKKLFTVHDDVKKQIRSYKLSKEDTERVFLYFDEHGKFTDCNLLTKDQIDKLSPLLKKTNMQELIEKASKEDHGTSVEFELNPKYFNNLDISFNVDLMKQYLQDIAMTNPGLEVQFVFKGKKEKYKVQKRTR
ncbi:DNA topoisomerase II, N-terminal domain protein [Leptospira interrogans serovar Canicola]|nr:DNA topoisomerase II, N-terminal domain protein [Leptospira interrogans serovar Canicola]